MTGRCIYIQQCRGR